MGTSEIRLVYKAGMYVWRYQVNKTSEMLLWLKLPVILHPIEFWNID